MSLRRRPDTSEQKLQYIHSLSILSSQLTMASILDQDFGSESDEGDFNPEPVAESDDDGKAPPREASHKNRSMNGVNGKNRVDDEDEEDDDRSERLTNGSRRNTDAGRDQDEEDDDDSKDGGKDEKRGPRRTQDDDDEEDEEDDEDEDDEDAISVTLY